MMIVKIGGGEQINTEGIVADLKSVDEEVIVVHGANALRDGIAEKMGTPKNVLTSISGYTSVFSDERMIDIILMSYAGLRNKRIVERFQSEGMNAIGLSGIDGRAIQGRRNRGIRVRENGKKMLKRDLSGKPKSVNENLLRLLLDNSYIPVLCIPILDEDGNAINSENDDIICALHDAMHADRIVQFIEAPGFLDDKDDETTVVTRMDRDDIVEREEQTEGRMKRKMLSLRRLFESNPTEVIIADGRTEHPLADALRGKGTVIR